MIDWLQGAFESINGYLWGPPMLILLVGTHIFLTFRLKFIQRHVFKGIKLSVTKDKGAEGDVSQFGALVTALAATLGTGNIIGVATAVVMGGPGAIFWLWIVGVFAIATKYAEGLVAVKYRVKTANGTMLGGPMYALENGLNMKWAAILFSIFCSLAAFGIGNAVQANSISDAITRQVKSSFDFGLSSHVVAAIIFILTFIVIIGGIKSIANVAEKVIPAMAILYIIANISIIAMNITYVPEALVLIVKSAFTPQAAGGGFVGSTIILAMRWGVARGLFSNEAGLGSAPLAAASATTRNPVRQALVSMSAVFWDTIIMCLLTGLMYTTTILKNPDYFTGVKPVELALKTFEQIPAIGPWIITICIALFAWTTIVGWCFYGERTMEYLFGKVALVPYRVAFCIVAYIGAVVPLALVWEAADTMNALMAIPNVLSVLLLSTVIAKESKKYLWDDNLEAYSDDVIRELGK